MITESEAWQRIGEAFEAKAAHPDLEMNRATDLTADGLCVATDRLADKGTITHELEAVMDRKTRREVNAQPSTSIWLQPGPHTPEGVIERATLAYLFAEETR